MIFGATGLVGSYLVDELLKDSTYSEIHLFIRRPFESKNDRMVQHVIDFDRIKDFSNMITGGDLFVCLGTTIRKAGSVRRVEEIDRDYPITIAQNAHENGVKRIAVVSSMGANSKSRNYYMRIKGEMEEGIQALNFSKTIIARPSMLLGQRKEFRLGELIAKPMMVVMNPFLMGKFAKYRAIHGRTVARAMIRLINSEGGKVVYLSDELIRRGD